MTWYYTKKRSGKRYYYPRLHLPIELLEKLGLKPLEDVEFEINLRELDGEKVIVLKPVRKAVVHVLL